MPIKRLVSLSLGTLLLFGLPSLGAAQTAAVGAMHPMDALTADEIRNAIEILRKAGKFDATTRVVALTLWENAKAEVRAWSAPAPFARQAFAVLTDKGRLYESVVDLRNREIADWRQVEGKQAAINLDEFTAAGEVPKADPRWREAMAKRGITNFDDITCFPLTVGPVVDPALAGKRLLNVPCVDKRGASNNLWGKPIEGLITTVDLDAQTVISVMDLGVVPLPPDTPSHAYADSDKYRAVPKPVTIAMPRGSNIAVSGSQVHWDNWSFHVRLDSRVGPVLSLVRYDDHGTKRDILYEISASEMYVPYMDPAKTWAFRAYMDIGEYGFGTLASPLREGEDCPNGATFLDATLADLKGEPVGMKNVICVFERPTGDPLWRHSELLNDTAEGRPNVELVVRSAPVVGNYDYVIDYVFDRSGNVDVRLGAFGIDATKGVAAKTMRDPSAAADTAYGTLVGKDLVAVNHDHYVAFRMDMDVDGPDNRLVLDRFKPTRVTDGGQRKSLWEIETTPIGTEGPITTPLNAGALRVESKAKLNALGNPTSYQLEPGHTDTSILAPDDSIQARAGFSEYTMWATAYDAQEKFAAGDYPNEQVGSQGLPKWVAAKRSIADRDLVLWYTVGFRHIPRAEDWPAMPGLWHGFRLRPFNFFDRNPGLDVAPVTLTEQTK